MKYQKRNSQRDRRMKKRSGELHLQRRHQIYKVIKHGYFIQLSSLFQMNISEVLTLIRTVAKGTKI